MTIKNIINKTFQFEIKNVNSQDPDYFYFKGYASTFGNADLGNDIIVKGAFTKFLQTLKDERKQLPILWQHDMDEPLGIIEEIYEDQYGLFISAKLPIADYFVRTRVIPQVKIGSVRELSIGFAITDSETQGSAVRYIKEIELYEVSLVTKAMNPLARVEGFKSVGNLKTIREAQSFLRSLGLSQNESKILISKIKNSSSNQEDSEGQQDVAQKTFVEEAIKVEQLTNLKNLFN